MLFHSVVFALHIYQSLNQYYFEDKDITIHYTQLHVDPYQMIQFTPPLSVIYKDELRYMSEMTANQLGEVYIRIPIKEPKNMLIQPIRITMGNISVLQHFDTVSHLQLSSKLTNKTVLEYNLQRISLFTYKTQMDMPIESDLESFIDSICLKKGKFILIWDKLKEIWAWITKQFQRLIKLFFKLLKLARKEFKKKNIAVHRRIMWHYLKLLQTQTVTTIMDGVFDKPEDQMYNEPLDLTLPAVERELENHLFFGTFSEHIQQVKPQQDYKVVSLYKNATVMMDSIIKNDTLQEEFKRHNISVLDNYRNTTLTTPEKSVPIVMRIINSLYKALKTVSRIAFTIVTELLKPFMALFAKIQFAILSIPVYVPFFNSFFKNEFKDSVRLIDLFLIPLSERLKDHFDRISSNFTEEESYLVTNVTSYAELSLLPSPVLYKLHYADKAALAFSFLFKLPFNGITLFNLVDWLNPLWNIATYLNALFLHNFDIFEPKSISTIDTRMQVARLFSVLVGFIPAPFISPISGIVTTLKALVYNIPFGISLLSKTFKLNGKNLPDDYENKALYAWYVRGFYLLQFVYTMVQLIPWDLIQKIALFAIQQAASLAQRIVNKSMSWKVKVLFEF